MKTKAMKKILSMLLVCVMLVGALAGFNVFAAEDPTIEIVSTNVWYGAAYYPMFAVKTSAAEDEFEVSISTDEGAVEAIYRGTETVKDYGTCYVYVANQGVTAQDIDVEYTITAKISEDVKATASISVLEYLYERLYVTGKNTVATNDDPTDAEKTMYSALIDYAIAAEKVFDDGKSAIESLYYVNVEGDVANTGMYEAGTNLKLTTTLEAEDGYVVVWTITDSNGNTTKLSVDEMAETGYTVNDTAVLIAAKTEESNEGKVETTLATFELGENGEAKHSDGGSTSKSTYSETNNGYTLNITGGTNMYTGARDAQGNSCIKFGTNSAVGKMTFTVPANVTQVKLYVAKYKANNTKVDVNGTTYTITNSSNAGQYDVITVDTTSSKTVTFTTVSSAQRAMLNTIEFIGYAD